MNHGMLKYIVKTYKGRTVQVFAASVGHVIAGTLDSIGDGFNATLILTSPAEPNTEIAWIDGDQIAAIQLMTATTGAKKK